MLAAPEATYFFKHALIQDAAYDALLKSRRRELHRRVAVALAQLETPGHKRAYGGIYGGKSEILHGGKTLFLRAF